eukprot:TRINITY_DN3430_c0_g1_i1.p1 TRINITY_DN3430_c0_g1~~TRINITY_DN3430_c0_g1_i1.p1  ORF type:complete len:395 (+),score=103.28 TRINITY_DN3430_c0_g1_i1:183-1367(+)
MAAKAWATARPSPRAGPMAPRPMVMPAVATEIMPMRPKLSIVVSFRQGPLMGLLFALVLDAGGRGYIDHGQHRENVRLDHAGKQAQSLHDHREEYGGYGQQDGRDLGAAHDVAEQPDRQGQGAAQLAQQVHGQHDGRGLYVQLEVFLEAPALDAVDGHPDQDHQGQGRGGGQRGGGRHPAGDDGQKVAQGDEQEQGAHKGQKGRGLALGDLPDLVAHDGHDHLQEVLPARQLPSGLQIAGGQPGAQGQQAHGDPGVDNGGVELDPLPGPEHQHVGADVLDAHQVQGFHQALSRAGRRRRTRIRRITTMPPIATARRRQSPSMTRQSAPRLAPMRSPRLPKVSRAGWRASGKRRTVHHRPQKKNQPTASPATKARAKYAGCRPSKSMISPLCSPV